MVNRDDEEDMYPQGSHSMCFRLAEYSCSSRMSVWGIRHGIGKMSLMETLSSKYLPRKDHQRRPQMRKLRQREDNNLLKVTEVVNAKPRVQIQAGQLQGPSL